MKYLCLDLGTKHTGLAKSDSTNIVEPVGTIHHQTIDELFSQLETTIKENRFDIVILGCPEKGIVKKIAQEIKDKIERELKLKVCLQDENLSSLEARRKMIETGRSPVKRKDREHAAAAAVILQDFLEENLKT